MNGIEALCEEGSALLYKQHGNVRYGLCSYSMYSVGMKISL